MPIKEQISIFKDDGIQVGSDYVCNDKFCRIQLDNLSSETSGAYRCEVSGDAPDFKLSHQTANMTVVGESNDEHLIELKINEKFPAFPQDNPKIEGLERVYYDQEFVFGNCTSDFSYPAPIMSWYLNEQKADPSFVYPSPETTMDGFGMKMYRRSLEIRFRIDKSMYPMLTVDGKIVMKCVAHIRQLPTRLMESRHTLQILTAKDIKNQMLINWKNSGELFFELFEELLASSRRYIKTQINRATLSVPPC